MSDKTVITAIEIGVVEKIEETIEKNTMVGVNEAKALKRRIHQINILEEEVNLLKAYLRYNKNRKTKVMPSQEVKDILGGKDLYDMPEPTPRREAQRYYDLVEGEYDQYDYLLEKKRRYLKKKRVKLEKL